MTPGPPTGSHGTRAARSRIATGRLRLRVRVVGRAGEAGDGFGLPRHWPERLRGSRRSRLLGAGRGGGLRRWLLLSGSGPGPPLWSAATQRCGPGRLTVTRTGGPSHPTASGPGAREPGPAESGLITYSVLQVLGLALATPTRRAGGRPHSPPSPPWLKAAEAGRRSPDRFQLVPAGPDSRSRFSIRVPRPMAREGRAQLGAS